IRSTIKEPHMRTYALLAALVLCSIAAPVGAQPALPAAIPPPDSDPVVETRFGITTTDPFRRLEDLKDSEVQRSDEQPSELQSLMRLSYAVFCLKKKKIQ